MDQASRGGNDVVAVQRRAAERPRPKKSEDGNRQPTQATRRQDDRPQLRTLIFDCGFGRYHRCSVEGGAPSAKFAHTNRNQRDSRRRERLHTGIRSNSDAPGAGLFRSARTAQAPIDPARIPFGPSLLLPLWALPTVAADRLGMRIFGAGTKSSAGGTNSTLRPKRRPACAYLIGRVSTRTDTGMTAPMRLLDSIAHSHASLVLPSGRDPSARFEVAG